MGRMEPAERRGVAAATRSVLGGKMDDDMDDDMDANARSANGESSEGGGFTSYILSLAPDGTPPTPTAFDRAWEALRGVLAWELRRRGLWQRPPHDLGYHGHPRWTSGAPRTKSSPADALDELVADAYAFIFIDRMTSLRAHARVKPNIEGLVFLNARHFLSELQERHDPLGSRVYRVLRNAVGEMVDEGILKLVDGKEKLGSQSILAFRRPHDTSGDSASEGALQPLVERWGDELLPDLVTTRGPGHRKLAARLREHLRRLDRPEIPAFRLGDVVRLLARDVRRRWAAVLDEAQGEKGIESLDGDIVLRVPLIPPDSDFETRQSFRRWAKCVARSLKERKEDERTLDELEALWDTLLDRALDRAEEGKMPSRREVARLLGIPRDRLPSLYEILGEIVDRCREAVSRPPRTSSGVAVASSTGGPGESGMAKEIPPDYDEIGEEDVGQEIEDETYSDQPGSGGGGVSAGTVRRRGNALRDHLRRATGDAVLQADAARAEALGGASFEPRPGEIFVLRDGTATPIEWLVVAADREDPERYLAIPADTSPLAGSRDVTVPTEDPDGPLTLRPELAVSLPRELFEAELVSRRLGGEHLERARANLRRFTGEAPSPRDRGDDDPTYREWLEELTAAVRATVSTGETGDRAPLPFPSRPSKEPPKPPWRRLHFMQRLAAVLAVACLGLAWWVGLERRASDRVAEPTFVPPTAEIVLGDETPRGPEHLHLPPGAELLLLDLVFRERPTCAPLRLDILAAADRLIWSSAPFEPPLTGELRLALPSRFLERKPSELRLLGRCEGDWRLLEQRPLEIEGL